MAEKQSVLIVCRTAAGQMYLGVLLNRIWYSPILVRTVEEGIRFAERTHFSIILFDGDIPQSELLSSLSRLKGNPALSGLPLVIFRTDDDADTNELLVQQGCTAVLTKPLDLTILYGLLQRLSGQPRTTPRVPVKIPVEIREGVPKKNLTCINISEGGMYLRTLSPLPEGTIIHMKFTLPHDTEAIELAAEVVRTLPLAVQLEIDPGMGLRFADISEETVVRIRNFVEWEMTSDLEWKSNI